MKKRIAIKDNQRIKAILLDVGGVLALGENSKQEKGKFIKKRKFILSGVHIDVAQKLKISLDQYLDSIDTAYVSAITGKLSKKQAIETLSKNLNVSKKELIKIYSLAYTREFKQNKELLKRTFNLKKRGYKIAILSDQWHLSKEALMPKEIYKKFNVIIVSCDAGIRKPDKKIYQLAVKKLKLAPQKILFIDNQQWNILPAKKLGMKTILFRNNKQLFKEKIWRNLFKK